MYSLDLSMGCLYGVLSEYLSELELCCSTPLLSNAWLVTEKQVIFVVIVVVGYIST